MKIGNDPSYAFLLLMLIPAVLSFLSGGSIRHLIMTVVLVGYLAYKLKNKFIYFELEIDDNGQGYKIRQVRFSNTKLIETGALHEIHIKEIKTSTSLEYFLHTKDHKIEIGGKSTFKQMIDLAKGIKVV